MENQIHVVVEVAYGKHNLLLHVHVYMNQMHAKLFLANFYVPVHVSMNMATIQIGRLPLCWLVSKVKGVAGDLEEVVILDYWHPLLQNA